MESTSTWDDVSTPMRRMVGPSYTRDGAASLIWIAIQKSASRGFASAKLRDRGATRILIASVAYIVIKRAVLALV